MNIPKSVELAVCTHVRNTAKVGKDTVIRAWQSLKSDPLWSEDKDRTFPCIDVRCTPPMFDENMRTQYVDVSVLCCTKVDYDKSHSVISSLYESVSDSLDLLVTQFISGTGNDLSKFRSALETGTGSDFSLGGVSWASPVPPHENQGISVIGISLRLSYSRASY